MLSAICELYLGTAEVDDQFNQTVSTYFDEHMF